MRNINLSVIFLTFFCNYITECKLCFTSNSSLRETFFFFSFSTAWHIQFKRRKWIFLHFCAWRMSGFPIIKNPFHYAIKYNYSFPVFFTLFTLNRNAHILSMNFEISVLVSGRWPTWRTVLLYNTFISILYMFRANTCSSSGGQLY